MGRELTKQETANAMALPMAAKFVDWTPGKNPTPAPTLANARIALSKLNLNCWHDTFADKKYIGNSPLVTDVGEITDDRCSALRVLIRRHFDFDPGKNNMWDAINLRCAEFPLHPVRDYLERCHVDWDTLDRGSRVETMLIDYFGAADTEFNRAVSKIVMIASARRIFVPGCKFDYMTVLESKEGTNKSSGLEALYGPPWFTDQKFLGLDDKRLVEVVRGNWCVECGDLAGMKRAEVEDVKAQLSRTTDRVRPAYGRAVVEVPRQNVFWGSTNDDQYLRSQTGNRRFLPVKVKRIDIEALRRDRNLLWGEAVALHRSGASIMLPESQWQAASIEQARRTMQEPWKELVQDIAAKVEHWNSTRSVLEDHDAVTLGTVYENNGERERVTSAFVLWKVCGVPPERQTPELQKRLGVAMRDNGWDGPDVMKIGGRAVRGYERAASRDWEV